MFAGQWIWSHQRDLSQVVTELYSPWFPREGDNAIFTMEIIAKLNLASASTSTMVVDVYHKEAEDTGNGVLAVSNIYASPIGPADDKGFFVSAPIENLKEMVRFKYRMDCNSFVAAFLYRMLPTTWFNAAGTVA